MFDVRIDGLDRSCRTRWGGMLVFCVLLASGLTPLIAAEGGGDSLQPSREPGVFLEVETWRAAVRGMGLDYASREPTGGLAAGGEVVTLDAGRSGTVGLTAGWRFATRPVLSMEIGFWDASVEGFDQTGDLPGRIGVLLAAPAVGRPPFGHPFADRGQARDTIDGRMVELLLAVDHDFSVRASAGFLAGLRGFRLERQANVVYEATGIGGRQDAEFVNLASDARGWGPVIGARASFRFSPRFALRASARIALPIGNLDSRQTDTVFNGGSPLFSVALDHPSERRSFLQLGGHVSLSLRISSRLRAELGYRFEHWQDAAEQGRFVDDVARNAVLSSLQSATWEGSFLSVRAAF